MGHQTQVRLGTAGNAEMLACKIEKKKYLQDFWFSG